MISVEEVIRFLEKHNSSFNNVVLANDGSEMAIIDVYGVHVDELIFKKEEMNLKEKIR